MSQVRIKTPLDTAGFGTPALAVRRAYGGDLTDGPDGSWTPLQSNREGSLRVEAGARLAPWSTSDTATSAGGAAATITYAAAAGDIGHVIRGVVVSYDSTPTGGGLTITDNGNTVLSVKIAAAGATVIDLGEDKVGTGGAAVVVSALAGGGSVVATVNVLGHRLALAPGKPPRDFGILDFSDPDNSGLF